MSCSPSTLFVDVTFWGIPAIFDIIKQGYQNVSDGDMYDCALTSVPCESGLVNVFISSDPTLFYWFDVVLIYICLPLLVVVGIVGNTSNIIIFSTNDIASDSTNNLLLGLSVSDLINLLSIAALVTSCYLCFLDESVALTAFNTIFTHMFIISRSATLLSLDFVTVISIQRAVAVVFPFNISIIFSKRNTNIFISVLVLLCITMMTPMHVAYNPLWIYHPYFRKEISLGHHYAFGLETVGNLSTYYFNVHTGLDLVLMFVTGSLTVFKLKEQAENRATLKAGTSTNQETAAVPKTSTRERKVIKMSLIVCFVTFIMCCVTSIVNGLAQAYHKELFRYPISRISEFGLLLLASINSSFNFFLYLTMSDRYRATFRRCFRCAGNLQQEEK